MARHEAGHALTLEHFGIPVTEMGIDNHGRYTEYPDA
jgi:hypothetical protein